MPALFAASVPSYAFPDVALFMTLHGHLSLPALNSNSPDLYPDIDSLYIEEVELRQDRKQFYSELFRTVKIRKAMISRNFSLSIGELLDKSMPLTINSYGSPGSLSTISMRGTSSSHTQLNWNGFILNSPTTGIADLSVIPVFLFDDISVIYGGSGSIYGDAAFGGVVNIGNKSSWQKGVSVLTNIETASFSNNSAGLKIKLGTDNLSYMLASYMRDSENDFPYTDNEKTGSPHLRMDNNSLTSFGLLQDINLRLGGNNYLQLGSWLQLKRKEIPALLGSYKESLQEQTDSSLKIFVKWKKLKQRSSMEIRSAYVSDYLRYLDKSPGIEDNYLIDSEIRSKRFSLDANYRYFYASGLSIDMGANYSLLGADVKSYGTAVKEYRANIIAAARYKKACIDIAASLRMHFNSFERPPPLYSFSFKYSFPGDAAWIRAHVASKYRLPGLNDKYWKPGGNPGLKPEQGWGADIGTGINMEMKNSLNSFVNMDIHLFTNMVNNQIQWIPDLSYWIPVNYKKVWARGMESSLETGVKAGRARLELSLGYTMTIATAGNTDEADFQDYQLRYIPKHTARGTAEISLNGMFMHLGSAVSSRRYSTSDNDMFYSLDPYFVMNASIGYTFDDNLVGSILQFRINNLTNADYQVIRAYPVPGRSYMLGLTLIMGTAAMDGK